VLPPTVPPVGVAGVSVDNSPNAVLVEFWAANEPVSAADVVPETCPAENPVIDVPG